MKKPFIQISSENFIFFPFEIEPIEDYEKPVNSVTGEEFPFCCDGHKETFEIANKWFDKFPNCCKPHKALASKKNFNIRVYDGLPDKIMRQIAYTEHHINRRIDSEDWYDDITEYIQYNLHAFGFPSVGEHLYLDYLKRLLSLGDRVQPPERRKKLLKFIEMQISPPKSDKQAQTDFNVLYSTYQAWIRAFPFELSFMKHLKGKFERKLPFINGKPEYNRYIDISKVRLHTKESLIEALIKLTDTLISEVNTLELHEQNLLSEPQKLKLELILTKRRQKLKEGYSNNSKSADQRYRKILKDWLKDEIEFLEEITPLLPESTGNLNSSEQEEKSRTHQLIEEHFESIDAKGWSYAFSSESDYHGFVNLLTSFFELKEYTLPNKALKLKRGTKTRVGKVLNTIHRDLSEKTLKSDLKFIEIVRTLNFFKDEKDIPRALTH